MDKGNGNDSGKNFRREMSDDDSDVGLPQKGLNLIIKDALPDMRIATETRDLLNHCCIEFIK